MGCNAVSRKGMLRSYFGDTWSNRPCSSTLTWPARPGHHLHRPQILHLHQALRTSRTDHRLLRACGNPGPLRVTHPAGPHRLSNLHLHLLPILPLVPSRIRKPPTRRSLRPSDKQMPRVQPTCLRRKAGGTRASETPLRLHIRLTACHRKPPPASQNSRKTRSPLSARVGLCSPQLSQAQPESCRRTSSSLAWRRSWTPTSRKVSRDTSQRQASVPLRSAGQRILGPRTLWVLTSRRASVELWEPFGTGWAPILSDKDMDR